ncbi:MAG: replication associated protein [Arizlama virus AZLM_746]|nr:replication-associated protein [Odonata-associated circular virus-12]QXP07700.1 MAG: replication associated protein [Arizlama virus]
MSNRRQGTYWLGTIPFALWIPFLPAGCSFIKGQREIGQESSYEHWQVFVITTTKQSLHGIKRIFGIQGSHWELTRSSAAEEYVWKEATRAGDQFQFGERPMRRNSHTDWEVVKEKAKCGDLEGVPSDVFIRYYRTLTAIAADYCVPPFTERSAKVFWGPTGTGKSHRAWSEAGASAYSKDPRSKFWCGYRGQTSVVIDEFRGGIDIAHLLRWLDRYPVNVEVKGSSRALLADSYWITSNLHPRDWYPELDGPTVGALMRRLEVIEINELVL